MFPDCYKKSCDRRIKVEQNLDMLFLGRLFPPVDEEKVRCKARVDMQDAAIQLQWNLIKGFVENGIEQVKVVSYLPVDSWPKHFKDAFVSPIRCKVPGCDFKSAGFCNVTYVKQLLSKNVCNKDVIGWAKEKSEGLKVLVCYSCNNTLMRAVAAAKKVNSNIVTVQIIADITEFASNDSLTGLKKLFIQNEIKTNEKLTKYIDKYVLLTEQMKTKLGISQPYMVMEGICPEGENFQKNCQSDGKNKTILYTGSMNSKYGICELLKAFMQIKDPDFRLKLCGLGNAEDEISDAVKKDNRIEFLGKVSHIQALELQSQATVLVNPRQNNEEFTKYSFPSKNLEYLSSGKPLVAFKLDGIPNEYDDYINYVDSNSVDAFKEKLIEVCLDKDGAAAKKAEIARDFVLKNKNYKVQSKRIIDFV